MNITNRIIISSILLLLNKLSYASMGGDDEINCVSGNSYGEGICYVMDINASENTQKIVDALYEIEEEIEEVYYSIDTVIESVDSTTEAVEGLDETIVSVEDAVYGVDNTLWELESTLSNGIDTLEVAIRDVETKIDESAYDIELSVKELNLSLSEQLQTSKEQRHSDSIKERNNLILARDTLIDTLTTTSAEQIDTLKSQMSSNRATIRDARYSLTSAINTSTTNIRSKLQSENTKLITRLEDISRFERQELMSQSSQIRESIRDNRDTLSSKISGVKYKIESTNNTLDRIHTDFKAYREDYSGTNSRFGVIFDAIRNDLDDLYKRTKTHYKNTGEYRKKLEEALQSYFTQLYEKHDLSLEHLKQIEESLKIESCTMLKEPKQLKTCEVFDEQLNETVKELKDKMLIELQLISTNVIAGNTISLSGNEKLDQLNEKVEELCSEENPCFIQGEKLENEEEIVEEFDFSGIDEVTNQIEANAKSDSGQAINAARSLTTDIPGTTVGDGNESPFSIPTVPLNNWGSSIMGVFPVFEENYSCNIVFAIGNIKFPALNASNFSMFKDILGWFFSTSTIIYLIRLLISGITFTSREELDR